MIMAIESSASNKFYFIIRLNKLLFMICIISIILLLISLLFILCRTIFRLILAIVKLITRKKIDNIESNEECPICLESITSSDITTTYCNHTFHYSCIQKMLSYNNKCPLCRRIL